VNLFNLKPKEVILQSRSCLRMIEKFIDLQKSFDVIYRENNKSRLEAAKAKDKVKFLQENTSVTLLVKEIL
jgi:hypothetical protein